MKIYNKNISEKKIDLIIKSVTKKKDLVNLDKDFIKTHLKKFFEQNKTILDFISESDNIEKSAKFKQAVKYIREKARKVYGVFQTTDVAKREKLLEIYLKTKDEI